MIGEHEQSSQHPVMCKGEHLPPLTHGAPHSVTMSNRRLLGSPPPEMSGESYIIYENAQMISELETKLVMVYHPVIYILEVCCLVLGVHEGASLHLYLDYKALYSALLLPEMMTQFKKRRRHVVIEFLLGRLAMERDSKDMHKWTLTLENPKKLCDIQYFSQNSGITVVNENNSSTHGSEVIRDATEQNVAVCPGDLAGLNTSYLVDTDCDRDRERRDELLYNLLRDHLKRLICDKPTDLAPFDLRRFYMDKR